MVRKLKFHEQKLLKKVDLIEWKKDNNLREAKVRFFALKLSLCLNHTVLLPLPLPLRRVPIFLLLQVMRKYHIQNREDYTKYNKICGGIKSLAARIRDLDTKSATRSESSAALIQKLYNLGAYHHLPFTRLLKL